MILHSSIYLFSFEDKGKFAIYNKDYMIEMFELHASMRPMQSAEYQATMSLKFLIIIHNYWGMRIFRQSTNQITTRFLGSSDVTGQH